MEQIIAIPTYEQFTQRLLSLGKNVVAAIHRGYYNQTTEACDEGPMYAYSNPTCSYILYLPGDEEMYEQSVDEMVDEFLEEGWCYNLYQQLTDEDLSLVMQNDSNAGNILTRLKI